MLSRIRRYTWGHPLLEGRIEHYISYIQAFIMSLTLNLILVFCPLWVAAVIWTSFVPVLLWVVDFLPASLLMNWARKHKLFYQCETLSLHEQIRLFDDVLFETDHAAKSSDVVLDLLQR